MTRRVIEPEHGGEYQLPPGRLWWLCRYMDEGLVSEILFTDEEAGTWFQANAIMGTRLGFKTRYMVTLHGQTDIHS